MRTDDIAVARPRYRADHRAAFARGCRAPVNGEAKLAAGLGMRGEADMIGTIDRVMMLTGFAVTGNGIGPPTRTGQTFKFYQCIRRLGQRSRPLQANIALALRLRNRRRRHGSRQVLQCVPVLRSRRRWPMQGRQRAG